MTQYGKVREDQVLPPVTGKALPVYRGEVLRITQEEEGGQCVDFNAFNLYDYREHLDCGRTRMWNGMFPKQGDLVWTQSPRDRAMFKILEMPDTCKSETLGARCNATLFERILGLPLHTNCQDTLAESIGEYDLTPDDVHDSLNFWMNTEVDSEGRMTLTRNTGRKGDYVDLLAIFDTLAVPIVCGSGDVFTTSNFRLKSIRYQVFEASKQTLDMAEELDAMYNRFRNQRQPSDFRVSAIKSDRELRRNQEYKPQFVNYPLDPRPVRVELDAEEYAHIERIRELDLLPGLNDGDVLRAGAMVAAAVIAGEELEVEFVMPKAIRDTEH
jgi:uncharacterized protein YcgI (DUF1989 family)